jgi:hypothetical protein
MSGFEDETGEEAWEKPENEGPAPDPMEQVRELLFGATKRSTEHNLQALEEKLDQNIRALDKKLDQNVQALDEKMEAMRADLLARLAVLENQLHQLARDTEDNRAASIHAVGSAIAQLGATVQNLSVQRKGG